MPKMRSAILIFGCVLSVILGLDLPSYIPKCSLSDPDLNQCIETNGNLVIPQLFKRGESSLNIQVLSPLFLPKLELPGSGFTVVLTNAHLEGLENSTLRDVVFNLSAIHQRGLLKIPVLKLVADYKIITNGFFARSIHGGGKMNLALEQNLITTTYDTEQYEEDGELYIRLLNWNLSLKTQRILYLFTNLFSRSAANFYDFLNQHKEIVDYRILPAVERWISKNGADLLYNLTKKVPLKSIFDP